MLYTPTRDHKFSGEIQNRGWMYAVSMGDGWREGCKWREGTWGEDNGGAQAAPSSCNHTVVPPQSLHSGSQLGCCPREDVSVPLILGRREKHFSLTERDRDVGKPTPGHSTGQEQSGLWESQYITLVNDNNLKVISLLHSGSTGEATLVHGSWWLMFSLHPVEDIFSETKGRVCFESC